MSLVHLRDEEFQNPWAAARRAYGENNADQKSMEQVSSGLCILFFKEFQIFFYKSIEYSTRNASQKIAEATERRRGETRNRSGNRGERGDRERGREEEEEGEEREAENTAREERRGKTRHNAPGPPRQYCPDNLEISH